MSRDPRAFGAQLTLFLHVFPHLLPWQTPLLHWMWGSHVTMLGSSLISWVHCFLFNCHQTDIHAISFVRMHNDKYYLLLFFMSMNNELIESRGYFNFIFNDSAIKNLPAVQETCRRHRFDPWVGKIPWRRAWQPLQHSCLESPMDRGAQQVQSMRSQELYTTERLNSISSSVHTASPLVRGQPGPSCKSGAHVESVALSCHHLPIRQRCYPVVTDCVYGAAFWSIHKPLSETQPPASGQRRSCCLETWGSFWLYTFPPQSCGSVSHGCWGYSASFQKAQLLPHGMSSVSRVENLPGIYMISVW